MTDRGGAGHPLLELTLARLREFLREPEAVFWVFAFPILLAFALGIAFRTTGETPVHVGIVDSAGAAPLARALEGAGGLDVRLVAVERVDAALRDGEVELIVVPGSPPAYRFDPTRAESRLARLAVDQALQRASGREDRWRPREERVTLPGSRYIDWLIPGLLGLNIMGTSLWSVGYAIVQSRTRKLLKRLVATPMGRDQYLLAHMLARLVFLGLEVAPLLLFGWLVFGVPVRGSLVSLTLVAFLGAASFGGIGLLIASRARTVEAVSGLMNAVSVPMWVLSGVFFSSANFPAVMQPFIHALPLTALNEAMRAVMLDGDSILMVGRQLGVLTLWGLVSFVVALQWFRWQ
ncbi:MAG: ABC transporter permease [Planctomycetes bacterium]|nr:ABC transporter permease [Planctomycetota bacterium]